MTTNKYCLIIQKTTHIPEFYLFDTTEELRVILEHIVYDDRNFVWNDIISITMFSISLHKNIELSGKLFNFLAPDNYLIIYSQKSKYYPKIHKKDISRILLVFVKFFVKEDKETIFRERNKMVLSFKPSFAERLRIKHHIYMMKLELIIIPKILKYIFWYRSKI